MSVAKDYLEDVLRGRSRWSVIHGDCARILPMLPSKAVAAVITDPPYSEHVHSKNRRMLRGAGRAAKTKAGGKGRYGDVGLVPLDFSALKDELRSTCSSEFVRLANRWILAFSNAEATHLWEESLEAAGARHIRVGVWVKIAAQPQLTGDRPGTGCEMIEIAHSKSERCAWNGGGHHAVWHHMIATDRNGTGDRVHTTQKPLPLMLELIEQFTDPDEIVLDPFCGSGTTGVACLRLGRRFLGVELDRTYAKVARERLAAEVDGISLRDARAGQIGLFAEAK